MFARIVTLNVVGTFNVTRLAATAMSRNEPGPDGDRGAMPLSQAIAQLKAENESRAIRQVAPAVGPAAPEDGQEKHAY